MDKINYSNRPNRFNSQAINEDIVGGGFMAKRVFPNAFNALLANGHKEGTPYGLYHNTFKSNGESLIYVNQKKYEDILRDLVLYEGDSFKYLVGFNGIGKTTLLRNFFKTFNRCPEIRDDMIVLYISFYDRNLDSDKPNESIRRIICEHLDDAVRMIFLADESIPNPDKDKDFFEKLYKNIEENDKTKLRHLRIIPGVNSIYTNNVEDEILRMAEDPEQQLSYYLFLLKFVLNQSTLVKKVVFIYDDIESHANLFHSVLLNNSNQIHLLMTTHKNRTFYVKTIISLKGYTFRQNLGRQQVARRIDDHDVILKSDIPSIKSIFNARFESGKKGDIERIGDSQSLSTANEILNDLCNELSIKFDDTISKLTNYDIFSSLKAFVKIVSNHRYFAAYERDNQGAFKIEKTNYNFKTAEPVFKALAYGEGSIYNDADNHMFCNILHNHNDECPNCELLGLYIVNYLITSKNCGNNTLYGIKSEIGKNIVDNISNAFPRYNAAEIKSLKERLEYMMGHLYKYSVILRSIKDFEEPEMAEAQTQKEYHNDFGIYLSLRGEKLFELLSNSSLLFEIYYDDIDTPFGTHVSSTSISEHEILAQLILYTKYLFEIEQDYIQHSDGQIKLYVQQFGNDYIISPLLVGIINSVIRYYSYDYNAAIPTFKSIGELINELEEYSQKIYNSHAINIGISHELKTTYNELEKLIYCKSTS